MTVPKCNHPYSPDSLLACVLPADHPGNGHVYVSSSGMHGDAEAAGDGHE